MNKKIELTNEEREILIRMHRKGYKWIAKNENGRTFVHKEFPYKNFKDWTDLKGSYSEVWGNFSVLSWEDAEPTFIEKLLKESKPLKEWLETPCAILTFRSGKKEIVINAANYASLNPDKELFVNNSATPAFSVFYNDDLKDISDDPSLDIMKIEFGNKVIWERREEKQKIKLTEDEKQELQYLLKVGYKYIVKNNHEQTVASTGKLLRFSGIWAGINFSVKFSEPLKLGTYPMLSSKDDEPFSIEELLKENE